MNGDSMPVKDFHKLKQWERIQDRVVDEWKVKRPGHRPRMWWTHNSAGPRKRLGGTGDLMFKRGTSYERGIPEVWLSPFQACYFRGMAVDVNGQPLESVRLNAPVFSPEEFHGVPPDPADPPMYESEPAFLLRHKMLSDSERQLLTEYDFKPVPLPEEYWPTWNQRHWDHWVKVRAELGLK